MKANYEKQMYKRLQKEANAYMDKEWDERQHKIFADSVKAITMQAAAMFLWALNEDFGFGSKRLNMAYESFLKVVDFPKVFNQRIGAAEIMEKLSREYGIDFDRINPHIESAEAFHERVKK